MVLEGKIRQRGDIGKQHHLMFFGRCGIGIEEHQRV